MEIFMKKFMISIALICSIFFFAACGGSDSQNEETQDADAVDEPDTEEVPDEQTELPYPEVTKTSTEVGEIAQNITIFDDQDVEHKLAEWYKPNNPESKLIWLIFTTYDCPYCQILEQDLLEINLPEYREQGFKIILVFNGYLYEGPKPEEEPASLLEYKEVFLSMYPDRGRFELYGYLKMEEQKVLGKFMGLNGGYPTHMLIDASTMEILDYMAGWGEDSESLVNEMKEGIEYFLYML